MALACAGCKLPFFRQTFDVDKLEVGMKPEAVRALLGEPEWVEEGMAPEAVRVLVEASGSSVPDTWPGLRATETWAYADELVDPATGAAGRLTCLFFEDDRLAAWTAAFGDDCAVGQATPGGEMVYDPEIEAYRVVDCGVSALGDHCAHYYRNEWFYRLDDDGWCRSVSAFGLFSHIPVADVPRTLGDREGAATRNISGAELAAMQARRSDERREAAWKARAELAGAWKAKLAAIRRSENQSIQEATQEADAQIAAIQEVKRAAIDESSTEAGFWTKWRAERAARREAGAQIKAVNESRTAAIQAVRREASVGIEAIHAPTRTYTGGSGRPWAGGGGYRSGGDSGDKKSGGGWRGRSSGGGSGGWRGGSGGRDAGDSGSTGGGRRSRR